MTTFSTFKTSKTGDRRIASKIGQSNLQEKIRQVQETKKVLGI